MLLMPTGHKTLGGWHSANPVPKMPILRWLIHYSTLVYTGNCLIQRYFLITIQKYWSCGLLLCVYLMGITPHVQIANAVHTSKEL